MDFDRLRLLLSYTSSIVDPGSLLSTSFLPGFYNFLLSVPRIPSTAIGAQPQFLGYHSLLSTHFFLLNVHFLTVWSYKRRLNNLPSLRYVIVLPDEGD